MKKFIIYTLLLSCLCSARAQEVNPTWESINQRGYPQWFDSVKLGIFVHWGLYSVPAYAHSDGYAEWLYRGLMQKDSGRCQIMNYYAGFPSSTRNANSETWLNDYSKSLLSKDMNLWLNNEPFIQYAALRNFWHAELWNPQEWASLFKESGAGYVLLVTKHHDGYCLWDCDNTAWKDWNSVKSGPARNIVEELTTAIRNQGLRMGFYYSLPEWTNPLHTWMVDKDEDFEPYAQAFMIPQLKELIDRWHPSVLFTDGEWQNSAEELHARELIAYYYNTVGPEAIANDRWGSGHLHGYKTPEYKGAIADTVTPWAECRGLGRSFGLNRNEPLSNYFTSEGLIKHFVMLVAAGGGLTLNVGPAADGHIPMLQQERLKDLGSWLKVNGEAIYGTRPYPTLQCSSDSSAFFTRKGNNLYVICVNPEADLGKIRSELGPLYRFAVMEELAQNDEERKASKGIMAYRIQLQ